MEFEATIAGEKYTFSSVNQKSFLITGPAAEYILYKHSNDWRCAEDIRETLLVEFSAVLDERSPIVK